MVNPGGVREAETWLAIEREASSIPPGHMVDLHGRLPGAHAEPDAAWEALASHRAEIDIAGQRLPTLSEVALAAHLATHAAQHGSLVEKPLEDLRRGLERWDRATWESAARLASEIGATDAFGSGLRMLPEGTSLAAELEIPMSRETMWRIANRTARPRGTFHLEAFLAAPSHPARLGVLRQALLPDVAWMRWQYPWAAGGALRLAGAYCIHLLRTPYLAGRAWAYRRRARRSA